MIKNLKFEVKTMHKLNILYPKTLIMKNGGDKDWILDHLVLKALVRANSSKSLSS